MNTDYTRGRAEAWAFRWKDYCRPGKYFVTVCTHGDIEFIASFSAVVDDFGNLVGVPS